MAGLSAAGPTVSCRSGSGSDTGSGRVITNLRGAVLRTRTGNDRVDAERAAVVTAADLRGAGNRRCIGDERDRERGAPVEVGGGTGSGPRRLARAGGHCP